ncbi:hypothetical protein CALCODRAFT_511478 [Calocera cornea HHB12733]|uniref:Uncharacterized protein n=1 Tax=Calocera cornea HHB12733 TaxID=1353952 RepID=A0A165DQU1_9BASI|nr:hypothetical protein CALCODRAFT_511478 [Calocera cornea HHB12733]
MHSTLSFSIPQDPLKPFQVEVLPRPGHNIAWLAQYTIALYNQTLEAYFIRPTHIAQAIMRHPSSPGRHSVDPTGPEARPRPIHNILTPVMEGTRSSLGQSSSGLSFHKTGQPGPLLPAMDDGTHLSDSVLNTTLQSGHSQPLVGDDETIEGCSSSAQSTPIAAVTPQLSSSFGPHCNMPHVESVDCCRPLSAHGAISQSLGSQSIPPPHNISAAHASPSAPLVDHFGRPSLLTLTCINNTSAPPRPLHVNKVVETALCPRTAPKTHVSKNLKHVHLSPPPRGRVYTDVQFYALLSQLQPTWGNGILGSRPSSSGRQTHISRI